MKGLLAVRPFLEDVATIDACHGSITIIISVALFVMHKNHFGVQK